jgi:very-short-patch-repair endonuclease
MPWALFRRKQVCGFRFPRQAPIGPYFADAFRLRTRLVIGLDCPPHSDGLQIRRDGMRRRRLDAHG